MFLRRFRGQLGWVMGAIGALLVIVAAVFWSGGGPGRTVENVTLVPTAAQMVSPVTATPPLMIESPLVQAGQAFSPLGQPVSPIGEGARAGGPLLLPTVVADEAGMPDDEPDDEIDDEIEEPVDPDEPPRAPVFGVEVVNVFPHDPEAFTQGLEFRDGELFEGTGLRGYSWLRRVDLETGEVLQQADLEPQYFGEGITVFGDRIYQLTWQSLVGFVYDRETFELIDTVAYSTEGWGLTHDGERLIMSDGSATITFRDPETFDALDTIQVTDGGDLIVRLNELEYIEGEIWANIWLTDRIARIDPETGQVNAWLDLRDLLDPQERIASDAVLNGIAYDAENERIFVTGKLWPYLFEIRVLDRATEIE